MSKLKGMNLRARTVQGKEIEEFAVKFLGDLAFGVINECATDKEFLELFVGNTRVEPDQPIGDEQEAYTLDDQPCKTCGGSGKIERSRPERRHKRRRMSTVHFPPTTAPCPDCTKPTVEPAGGLVKELRRVVGEARISLMPANILKVCYKAIQACDIIARLEGEKENLDFWKDIVCKDKELDVEQVKKELADFRFLIQQVPLVYYHVAGLSKVMYKAETIITAADDRMQEWADECIKEATEPIQAALAAKEAECESLKNGLISIRKSKQIMEARRLADQALKEKEDGYVI